MAILRWFFTELDSVAFAFIDDAYEIILGFATGTFITTDSIKSIIQNMYVIVGIFALFRIALLIINSLINPEKLSEKGKGVGSIFFRTVLMLVMLIFSPIVFTWVFEFQEEVMTSNIIPRLIVGSDINNINTEPGKQMRNIAISALITVNPKAVAPLDPVTGEELKSLDGMENYTYFYDMIEDNSGNKKYAWCEDAKKSDSKLDCTAGSIVLNPLFKEDNTPLHRKAGYKYKDDVCNTSSCTNAVIDYNKLYISGDMEFEELDDHINTKFTYTTKDASGNTIKEKEYVYDYMILLTTATGVFITYVLFSFALDLAIRVFELAALQILSPIFIVTFIDPKSASSGSFNKWLKAFGSSFASLFIRIVIVCLIIFLVSWINEFNVLENPYFAKQTALAKLILIWGLLAFAKKAPKWISNMFGMQSDGLGSLGIGKKIAGAALGGAAIVKGAKALGKGVAGGALALGKNASNLAKYRRNQKNGMSIPEPTAEERKRNIASRMKDLKKQNPNMTSSQARTLAQRQYEEEQKKAVDAAKKNAHLDGRATAAQIGSLFMNTAGAIKASAKADKLSGALKVSNEKSNTMNQKYGLSGEPTIFNRIKGGVNKGVSGMNETGFGSAIERKNRADDWKKEQNERNWYRNSTTQETLANNPKSFNSAIETSDHSYARNFEDAMVVMGAKLSGVKEGNISYDGNNLKINGAVVEHGSAEYNRYFDKQANNLTESGLTHFMEMFSKTQNNAFNEYQGNSQMIDQMASTINSLNNAITNSFNSINSKFSDLAAKTNLNFNPNDGALTVRLDNNQSVKIDMENMSESLATLRNSGYDTSKIEENLYEFEALSRERAMIEERTSVYKAQVDNATSKMEAYTQRNQSLEGIIENVKYNIDDNGRLKVNKDGSLAIDSSAVTLAGKQEKLNRELSKVKEKIDYIEAKESKEKK